MSYLARDYNLYSKAQNELSCIFNTFEYKDRKRCSTDRALVFVCDTHARDILRISAKRERLTDSAKNEKNFTALKFASIVDDEFMPFPFLYKNGEFCINREAIISGNYNNPHLASVLMAICSDGTFNDFQQRDRYFMHSGVSQQLANYAMILGEYTSDKSITISVETGNERVDVPLAKFPNFYRMLISCMQISTTIQVPVANVPEEAITYIPNVHVNATNKGFFQIINKSPINDIYLHTGVETFATTVCILGTRTVPSLKQDTQFKSSLEQLVKFPNMC